jgi:glycosyltransferase involved in cell wall biosynthesis
MRIVGWAGSGPIWMHAFAGPPGSDQVVTWPKRGKVPVSVLIPARNEADNIGPCIDSLSWASDIVVLDSMSDDNTAEIASAHQARVVSRVFDNYAANKDWALSQIDFRHEWILIVDADERGSDALGGEIARLLADAPACNGYYLARKNMFWGRWLKHCGMYPDWNLRLLRRGRARYETRVVHEHVLLDGPLAGWLTTPLVHFSDNKGIERYIERHNQYTSLEAVEAHRLLIRPRAGTLVGRLLAKGPKRRRALKEFAYRSLPGRPIFVFLYMYFLQLGLLDGWVGLHYCLMRMIWEYQIDLKLHEMRDCDSPQYRKYKTMIEEVRTDG